MDIYEIRPFEDLIKKIRRKEITALQRQRIRNTTKLFAVFIDNEKLHLVKDEENLDRLFRDRLRDFLIYDLEIYYTR